VHYPALSPAAVVPDHGMPPAAAVAEPAGHGPGPVEQGNDERQRKWCWSG
jgi:hypothetical protein